jgi:hypothetical protein
MSGFGFPHRRLGRAQSYPTNCTLMGGVCDKDMLKVLNVIGPHVEYQGVMLESKLPQFLQKARVCCEV